MQPAVEVRVPTNQLQLSEAALEEEIAKMLTANNPEAPKALVRFIQKERSYKPEAMIVQTMTHYATDGWLLHKDCEEAKKQLDVQKQMDEMQKKFNSEVEKAANDGSSGQILMSWNAILNCVDIGNIGTSCQVSEQFIAEMLLDDSKELRNQFNFSERAAQTSSLYPKDKETMTEPPPAIEISGMCSQSVIYDEYVRDQERLERQDRLLKQKAAAKKVCRCVDRLMAHWESWIGPDGGNMKIYP
jgi:dynein intermediate chain 1, axonemal